jgi:sugar phosphate isomerase/epimerase
MKLAISNIAWMPEERGEVYDLMADLGVTGLEIAPGLFFNAAADPFLPSPDVARTALTEIEDRGFTIVSMQSLLFGVAGAALFDGAEARANLTRGMERAINLAGRFGIPNIVFGSPKQRRVPEGLPMNEALDQAVDLFRHFAAIATSAGTKIAIEANPSAYGTNFLNTLDESLDFVQRVNHSAVVSMLDLGAMHMNGVYASILNRIPCLLPTLHHVHVSEPNLAPAPRKASALAPVLSALRKAGYHNWVSIEMKRPPEGVSGVRSALHRLVTAASEFDVQHG